ncbi:DUF2812 domain-containing protein [Terribacillus sp. 179-K 1B1 HS]|uniref:DUF2812 domain-containing protein n=1 Tax=Terribacillus sp. 179-K 1B1 HS TaxID=3142388 RepID=UPI0039A06715
MNTDKKVFKVFLAWQDKSEEIWLNRMAKKGWALKSYKFLYTFEKIEPASYIYRLDYKSTSDNDLNEYKTIFQDTGWEYVTRYGNWHYFRTKESQEHTPEIYTEHEYQIEKYNSLLQHLLTVFITFIILAVSMAFLQNSIVLDVFFTLLIMIFILCIFKVGQKISKLRE